MRSLQIILASCLPSLFSELACVHQQVAKIGLQTSAPNPILGIRHSAVWAAQSCSRRANCSNRRYHTHRLVPSALAARLPPNSPPNPTFALLAEYRGLPVIRPAEHAPLRADLEYRCIGLHAASPARRSARETPSDRSLPTTAGKGTSLATLWSHFLRR